MNASPPVNHRNPLRNRFRVLKLPSRRRPSIDAGPLSRDMPYDAVRNAGSLQNSIRSLVLPSLTMAAAAMSMNSPVSTTPGSSFSSACSFAGSAMTP